ncbi:nuclear transport factor 2-like [Dasypus novemcinctus]|uniref:nuclear transport factor 2-like n=1 Tax=Dasypus novemcinctus TaxID=9361 RepID=UPI0039C8F33F
MTESPVWEQVGTSFVLLYYRHFDADRVQLGAFYTDASRLSWEGELFLGREAIVEKLTETQMPSEKPSQRKPLEDAEDIAM